MAWIPADHNIVLFRTILWGFVAIPTSKEWYEYVSNSNCHRLGPFAWMTFYVASIELSSVYKFRGNEFVNPFPWWIKIIWFVIGVCFCIGFWKANKNGNKDFKPLYNPYNPQIEIAVK